MKVDNDCTAKGVSIENMNTLSTLVGSNFKISFIKYGINYKVIVQAAQNIAHYQKIFKAVC
jgi:HAE1 family hydrophobic/amphiphilic exporter-1